MEAALDATNGEATEAKAAAAAAQAELAGELNFVFFGIHSICILMRVVLSFFSFFFPGVWGQFAAAQAEVTGLRQASEDLARQLVEAARGRNESAAWARTSAALAQSSGEHYSALRDAAVAAIEMMLPAGTSLHDRLRCLPTQIREVVAHGVCHGTVGGPNCGPSLSSTQDIPAQGGAWVSGGGGDS